MERYWSRELKPSSILGGIPPSEPRIESRECSLDETRGKNKTDLPTQLKVANRSGFVAEGSPARDGAQRSEREKGDGHAPGDSKGRQPLARLW